MKDVINYYYHMYPESIAFEDYKYTFMYNGVKYVFERVKDNINIDYYYELNNFFVSLNTLFHKIIPTVYNKVLVNYNNDNYVLFLVYVNSDIKINIRDIENINNINIFKKRNIKNWNELWKEKVDAIEEQLMDIGGKYPNLLLYSNYYVGLCENAISYINLITFKNVSISLSHKRTRVSDTLYDLYNPLNIIIDYKVRDLSEYVKSLFINGKNPYNAIYEYFSSNVVSFDDAILFYSRLLYPSYFFDLLDSVISEEKDDLEIKKLTLMANKYEEFLYDINCFLSKLYNGYFPKIEWLKKESD